MNSLLSLPVINKEFKRFNVVTVGVVSTPMPPFLLCLLGILFTYLYHTVMPIPLRFPLYSHILNNIHTSQKDKYASVYRQLQLT